MNGGICAPNYNNPFFKNYGDSYCQNFLSQAIWYKMGDRSSEKKDLPMYSYWFAKKMEMQIL